MTLLTSRVFNSNNFLAISAGLLVITLITLASSMVNGTSLPPAPTVTLPFFDTSNRLTTPEVAPITELPPHSTSSTNNSQSSHSATVNGQNVFTPEEAQSGNAHKEIKTKNGSVKIDLHSQSNSNLGTSRNNVNVNVDTN
jgi:hypothetical protein